MRSLGVKIPDEIWGAIEERCQKASIEEGIKVTPSELMRRAIINYLDLKVESPPAGWGGKRSGAGKPKKNNPSGEG